MNQSALQPWGPYGAISAQYFNDLVFVFLCSGHGCGDRLTVHIQR